jgi:hypothetical protein
LRTSRTQWLAVGRCRPAHQSLPAYEAGRSESASGGPKSLRPGESAALGEHLARQARNRGSLSRTADIGSLRALAAGRTSRRWRSGDRNGAECGSGDGGAQGPPGRGFVAVSAVAPFRRRGSWLGRIRGVRGEGRCGHPAGRPLGPAGGTHARSGMEGDRLPASAGGLSCGLRRSALAGSPRERSERRR